MKSRVTLYEKKPDNEIYLKVFKIDGKFSSAHSVKNPP